jgi:hypothetical protein
MRCFSKRRKSNRVSATRKLYAIFPDRKLEEVTIRVIHSNLVEIEFVSNDRSFEVRGKKLFLSYLTAVKGIQVGSVILDLDGENYLDEIAQFILNVQIKHSLIFGFNHLESTFDNHHSFNIDLVREQITGDLYFVYSSLYRHFDKIVNFLRKIKPILEKLPLSSIACSCPFADFVRESQ